MKRFYIGCSGWYYMDWVGPFYPKTLHARDWLAFYAERFRTVEVNSTFYHFPREATLRSWYRRTPDGFLFTLKVYQSITHRRKFKGTQDLVRRFYEIGLTLEEKLGGFLFQLPPTFAYRADLLKEIVGQLDLSQRNSLEFRHPSWFNKDVYEFLNKNGIATCTVSAPGLPQDAVETAAHGFVRFHGQKTWYEYHYSAGELKRWAEEIRKLSAKTIFAYFNNDPHGWAPKNASELHQLLLNEA